jgi:hypothetical protein
MTAVNLDSALYCAQTSYNLAVSKNVTLALPYALLSMATSNYYLGNKGVAMEYLRAADRASVAGNDILNRKNVYTLYIFFFTREKQMDSAFFYASRLNQFLETGNYSYRLDPVGYLMDYYQKRNSDSALKYMRLYYQIKDSIYSTQKLSQLQALAYEESSRQEKIESEKLRIKEERKQNIQFVILAIGIISFITLFLALSHSVLVNQRTINFLGILSLLLIFEFINLLIHPYLGNVTQHSPVLMLAIMVLIAAILIPLHHRLEKWVTKLLIKKNNRIRLAAARKTIAALEGTEESNK